jgi:hypothetical protein
MRASDCEWRFVKQSELLVKLSPRPGCVIRIESPHPILLACSRGRAAETRFTNDRVHTGRKQTTENVGVSSTGGTSLSRSHLPSAGLF